MQNHKRAIADSSRRPPCRTCCDDSWIATSVVLSLGSSGKQSFAALLHSTGAGQSPLSAALSQLRADSWILQDDAGNFQLSSRGLNLVDEGRRRGGRRQRAAA
jgi:hypothetical protein